MGCAIILSLKNSLHAIWNYLTVNVVPRFKYNSVVAAKSECLASVIFWLFSQPISSRNLNEKQVN